MGVVSLNAGCLFMLRGVGWTERFETEPVMMC